MKDLNHHLHWLIPGVEQQSVAGGCSWGQMILFIKMTLKLIGYDSLQTFSLCWMLQGGCWFSVTIIVTIIIIIRQRQPQSKPKPIRKHVENSEYWIVNGGVLVWGEF